MIKTIKITDFMGIKGTKTVDLNTQDSNIHYLVHDGKNNSSIGLAIYDLHAHLGYNSSSYKFEPKNMNSDGQLYTLEFTFVFDGVTIVYEYGKKDPSKTVFEKITANGKLVAEINRLDSNIAFIDLAGAETLRRDFSSNEGLGVLRYLKNNANLDDNECNNAIIKLFNFGYDIRHYGLEYLHASLKDDECPHLLKAARFIEHNQLTDKLNGFMQAFSPELNLHVDNSWGTTQILVTSPMGDKRSATSVLSQKELSLILLFSALNYPSSVLVLDDLNKIMKPTEKDRVMKLMPTYGNPYFIVTE